MLTLSHDGLDLSGKDIVTPSNLPFLLSSIMTANSSTSRPLVVSPYSETELKQALETLLHGSQDPVADAQHMFGYNDPSHKLSMLQTITATRILDYNNNNTDMNHASLEDLLQAAREWNTTHGLRLHLQSVIQQQSPRMALAAEFKRASPSKGLIATSTEMNAGEQAAKYARAGADIISVLTEERWFQGSLADLTEVRRETSHMETRKMRPAVLRKDFVVNRYMVAEAAAAGADSVLLIVAVLPKHVLQDLIHFSRSLDMEPLVEVHAEMELEVALQAGATVIGVNNRNLHTFQMDLGTSERVAQTLTRRNLRFHHTESGENTPDYTLCALSGMSTCFDVDRYRQAGLGMCLIGESLMRATDPEAAIANLALHPEEFQRMTQEPTSDAVTNGDGMGNLGAYTQGTQIIKVCGITNPDDALAACRAGANLIGVIFAEKSPRRVTREQAKAIVQAVQSFGERQGPTSFHVACGTMPLPHLVQCSRLLVEGTRRPAVVGVFQNQSPETIREVVSECGLDLVQLHGAEGMAAANQKECSVPALRVVDISVDPESGKSSADAVENIIQSVTSDPIAILLDTSLKGQKTGGGTGLAFDWSIAQRLQDSGLPVIIAGGLNADSVVGCVENIRPFGVDVSSGVEASPGVKDQDKVRSFVTGARQAAIRASKGF